MPRKRWDGPDRVLNEPLRLALLKALADPDRGLNLSDVCRRLGWERADGHHAETARLKRCLGIDSTRSRHGTGGYSVSFVSTVNVERAKAICRAIEADFDEVYPHLPTDTSKPGAHCRECAVPMLQATGEGLCGFCVEEQAYGLPRVAA